MTGTSPFPAAENPEHGLAYYPVTLFASVLGFAGLSLALNRAELSFGWGHTASHTALTVTILVFAVVSAFFALKAVKHREAFAAEWHHPVKLAFFPAISISMLLISAALLPLDKDVARVVFLLGIVSQGALTLAVISGWIGRRAFQPMHISPAWFIPAVGNVIVPIAGIPLGFQETSWIFFSGGLMFWIVLLTLVMNRLIFHDPLPARLYPTLVILMAPPGVAFLGWLQLNGGELDALARILHGLTWVFLALVLTQAPALLRLPFSISWWALSFPVAALTTCTLSFAELSGSTGFVIAGTVFLAALCVIVAFLVVRTALAIIRNEICLPD